MRYLAIDTRNWNKIPSIIILLLILAFAANAQSKGQIVQVQKEHVRIQTNQAQELAPSPPMGWNSWNWFGKKKINEKIVRQVIDVMAADGLRDTGYTYVIVDGGWRATKLGPNGELKPNPKDFPHGIKPLADYAHSKGLKFGLHMSVGTADCGGDKVGGYGHEKVQVQQLIDWGVDFVKLDKCRMKGGWNEVLLRKVYAQWSRLLKNSGRDIVLSCSAYKFRSWNSKLCQMSRTTGDISANVNGGAYFDKLLRGKRWPNSVMANADVNNRDAQYAGNGYWNFPDMLPLGAQGLSVPEQKATFALWCIMSSPLILGGDPRYMTKAEKNIILNRMAIKVDQDPTEQGIRIARDGYAEIWTKHLQDGSVAVLLLNRSQFANKQITLHFKDIGLSGKIKIKKIYSNEYLGTFTSSFSRSVAPESGLFLMIKRDN
jgi:alpha-galactosidase